MRLGQSRKKKFGLGDTVMDIYENKVLSTDGIHTLYGKVYVPDGQVRAIVQVVHGKSEHIDRYDRFMTALAQNGYVACGHNHIGHKYSSSDEELGFFGYDSGFRHLINDVIAFGDDVSKQFDGAKRYLFGHSMGSFIVRLSVLKNADSLSGLIICGTGGPQAAAPAGLMLCNLITLLKGGKYVSEFMEKLTFSGFCDRFDKNDPNSWLTSDKSETEKFSNDKYCGFPFTVCAMHDLIKLNSLCNKPIWAEAVSKDLPIFIISGDSDPVGDFGRGVTTVYNRLKKAGCNVSLKLYPGARHEILNDFCKDQVTGDILDFLKNN